MTTRSAGRGRGNLGAVGSQEPPANLPPTSRGAVPANLPPKVADLPRKACQGSALPAHLYVKRNDGLSNRSSRTAGARRHPRSRRSNQAASGRAERIGLPPRGQCRRPGGARLLHPGTQRRQARRGQKSRDRHGLGGECSWETARAIRTGPRAHEGSHRANALAEERSRRASSRSEMTQGGETG
jgi:hypothetical protein